jgi:hypothetical protein
MDWKRGLCLINKVIDEKIEDLEYSADAHREHYINTPPIGELREEMEANELRKAKELLNKKTSFVDSLSQ